MKRQMIRGDRRLQCCKHKNFAARADLENRTAAIADVQIPSTVERDPRRDAHPFDPLLGAPIGRYFVNRPVVAARHKQIAISIQRQSRRIDQRRDKRLYAVVRGHLIKRHRNRLPARPAERHINIPFEIDRRIPDGMQVVCDLQSDRHRMRRALSVSVCDAHRSVARAIRHAHNHAILGDQHQSRIRLAEIHIRPRTNARRKPAPANHHFTAGNCRRRSYTFNVRHAVFFRGRPKSKFHSKSINLKCSAKRSRIAAYTPAAQSSAMMPQPPGSISRRRNGYGFQISKILKNMNPSSRYFQFTRLSAVKIANVDKSICECRFGSAIGISGSTSVKCCPATSSITTHCGSLMPEYAAAFPAAHTPIAPSTNSNANAQKIGRISSVLWMSLPGTRKCLSMKRASDKTWNGDSPASDVGRKKKIAQITIVATPTSEPSVPGALPR